MSTDPKLDPNRWPALARLQSTFERNHRLAATLIPRAMVAFGSTWAADFDSTLASLFAGEPESIEQAARGYVAFAFDAMRRQKAFERERIYRHTSYAQAARDVYFNERHMAEEYLPGLLLSHFLWPHHYRQLRFFDAAFLEPMQRSGPDPRFAEIGVGTGLYSRRLLAAIHNARGRGFDISPSSCAFTERHVAAVDARPRYRMHRQDVLAEPIEPVPWLVCVEVLEHLEEPPAFLAALRLGLAPGGRAFVTAALNAAHADHIYLYRSADEVWRQLEEAGFAIEQSFVASAYAPPAPGVPVPLAAAFVVQ